MPKDLKQHTGPSEIKRKKTKSLIAHDGPLSVSAINLAIIENTKYYTKDPEHEFHPDQLPGLPERVSQENIHGAEGNYLEAAEEVARGSLRTVRPSRRKEFAQFPEGLERRRGKNRIANHLRNAQTEALVKWAIDNSLYIDPEAFNSRWVRDGMRGGMEHDVYYDPRLGRWWKRNSAMAHLDYLEYLHRMSLHNYLFPDTALRCEGITENNYGEMAIVITQPDITAIRGTAISEVTEVMRRLGFNECKDPDSEELHFINYRIGLRVEDLHEKNALVVQENPIKISVIDPVIYMDTDFKLRRLASLKKVKC